MDFATPVEAFAFTWGAADNQWPPMAFDQANDLIEANLISAIFSGDSGDYIGVAAAENGSIVPIRGQWVDRNAGPGNGGRCWD